MSAGAVLAGNAYGAPDENPFPPKKIVMAKPDSYSPLTYLKKATAETVPKFAFKAGTVQETEAWRKSLRAALWDVLGESHVPGVVNPQSRLLETKTFDSYTQQKWELDVVSGRSMPVYVLRPKSGPNAKKTVLCLHGHGNGARDIIGMPGNEEAGELIRTINTDYALQVVKKGWCAVAPELFAFGERVDMVEDARPGAIDYNRRAASVLTGTLLAVAFPPFEAVESSWVAFVVMAASIIRAARRRASCGGAAAASVSRSPRRLDSRSRACTAASRRTGCGSAECRTPSAGDRSSTCR